MLNGARLVIVAVASGVVLGAARMMSFQQPLTVASGVYTSQQATRGKATYEKSCVECHMADLTGDTFATPLIGEVFKQRWQDSHVGELFTVIKATMPATKPGALADDEYADVAAYLLMRNDYPAGTRELGKDPEALAKIAFKSP